MRFETFSIPPLSELSRIKVRWPFSTDDGYGEILHQIVEPDIHVGGKPVALIVGNGSLLSSLPEIPVDLVLLCDKNPAMLHWTKFVVDAFGRIS